MSTKFRVQILRLNFDTRIFICTIKIVLRYLETKFYYCCPTVLVIGHSTNTNLARADNIHISACTLSISYGISLRAYVYKCGAARKTFRILVVVGTLIWFD